MAILNNSNAISSGGYDINNSLRFRASASAYLNRTFTTPTDNKKWTYSTWVKRSTLTSTQILLATASEELRYISDGGASGVVDSFQYNAGAGYGFRTNATYRDVSAWYHIVVAVDTTQATAANRARIYINGVEASTDGTYNISQNTNTQINSAVAHNIARRTSGSLYFDGYQAETYFVDGQQLTPSSFGETDATTGVWKPKAYTGTYGTNGFYLPFNNSNATGFSSYYGSFNGSNQYLTFTGNTGLQFGTGDFTVEYWMYQTSVPSQVTILDLRGTPTTAPGTFGMTNTGIIYYNGTSNISTSGFTPTANTWVHVAFSRASGVMKVFANGVQYYSASETTNFNTGTSTVYVGRGSDAAGYYMPGYVSNLRVVKGTALYTANFTPPSAPLTAVSGTQLLMLQNATFVDNSSNAFAITNNNSTTSVSGNVGSYAQINRDTSGNNNHWAMSNINYTASGTTYDAMTDSPTLTSATVANYAVLNPLDHSSTAPTVSDGNLLTTSGSSGSIDYVVNSSIGATTGKFYCEVTATAGTRNAPGVTNKSAGDSTWGSNVTQYISGTGNIYKNGTLVGAYATWTTSDVIGMALDIDNQTLAYYKNNTLIATVTSLGLGGSPNYFTIDTFSSSACAINFGQRPFTYTPPSGYVALNTYNLPTPTILQGNKYMDATLYTGTGASLSVTNAGAFKPDFVWVKGRSGATDHALYDSVRGTTKQLESNTTDAETTEATGLTAFGTGGFTVGALAQMNTSSATYVGWQWQAGQGSTSSNTSGTITSTVSVNATAGFSVVTYTGTGSTKTFGHGLGVTPAMFIVKSRSQTGENWVTWHKSFSNTAQGNMALNTTDAVSNSASVWGNTAPTSTLITVGNSAVNNNTSTYVAYCWAEIAGYSKAFSYTGNGSTDGSFVYTGFLPRFVMIKRTDTTGDWYMWDTARNTYDVITNTLLANSSAAETSATSIDALSNGFKLRNTTAGFNASSGTYIGMAWATNPFKNSNAF